MTAILREPILFQDVTIGATAAASTSIAKQQFAAGSIKLAASTTLTVIALWASHDMLTYGPVYDQYGRAVTITVTSGANPVFIELPDIVLKFPHIKLVDAAASETATLYLCS